MDTPPAPEFRNREGTSRYTLAVRLLPWVLVSCLLAAPGCSGSTERAVLEHAAATAASPTGGRAAASSELAAEFAAGRITVAGAIDHAQALLESAAAGVPPPGATAPVPSVDATLFAGGVLDFCAAAAPSLPQADEFYMMWLKMGRLAFRAAEEAHAAGRLQEAASLAFAGPTKWQNDGYWYQYPDHDALASVILARLGNRAEAIARLRSRAELRGPAQEVLDMLERGQ
jgi:hypothetical protein